MKQKICFLILAFVAITFAQSIESAKVVTPRDSVFALLDTTETCTSKFGADTTKWNDCINLKEGNGCTYFTFKKGKANGPAWETIGCKEFIRENGTFFYYRNGEEQYHVSYASNGYIDEIWRNNKWIYYGGRAKPFTGTDSIFVEGGLDRVVDYKNGLRDGVVIYYHLNGQIDSEVNYRKGKIVGNLKEYYENSSMGKKGAIRRITPYANGKKDGLVKEYYQNGQIWRTTSYKKGKREGKQIEYSAKTGKVVSTAMYKNDELVGDKKCMDGRFGSEDLDCTPLDE